MSNNNSKADVPKLSDREIQLVVYALRCSENGLGKYDAKKFAEMAGFKNAHSASVSFNNVKKKVMGEAVAAKPAQKKELPSKRKKAAAAAGSESDSSGEGPSKKVKTAPKKTAKKTAKKQQETEEDSDDDEGGAFI